MSDTGELLCEYRDASKMPDGLRCLRTGSREGNAGLCSGLASTMGRLVLQPEAEAWVTELEEEMRLEKDMWFPLLCSLWCSQTRQEHSIISWRP